VRKFVILVAILALWGASPSSALAAPTLTLSGTCDRVDSFPELGGVPALVWQVYVAGSGFQPNELLTFHQTESANANESFGPRQADATGAIPLARTFLEAIPLFANPPTSITVTGEVWNNDDRDLEQDPDEPILATDSVTLVCPPPKACDEIIAQAEASGALRHGEAGSLRAKCDSAERSAAAGHTKAARNKLTAFIHEVRAMLRSRRISSALGEELIDSANARIASLP
jgi:hypothetical protein